MPCYTVQNKLYYVPNSTDNGLVTVLLYKQVWCMLCLRHKSFAPTLQSWRRVSWAVKLPQSCLSYARSFLISSLIKWFMSAIPSAYSQTTSLNTEGHSSSNAVSLLLAATAPLVRPCAMLSDTFCVADGCICRAGCRWTMAQVMKLKTTFIWTPVQCLG